MANELQQYERLTKLVEGYNIPKERPLGLCHARRDYYNLAYLSGLLAKQQTDSLQRLHYTERAHMFEQTAAEIGMRLDDIQSNT